MYLAENVALRQQNVGRYCRVTHDSSNQPYSVKTALSAVKLFGAPNLLRVDGFWGEFSLGLSCLARQKNQTLLVILE